MEYTYPAIVLFVGLITGSFATYLALKVYFAQQKNTSLEQFRFNEQGSRLVIEQKLVTANKEIERNLRAQEKAENELAVQRRVSAELDKEKIRFEEQSSRVSIVEAELT